MTDRANSITRQESKSNSRKALLEATAESIYKHGLQGTTVGIIHELSGLSRGMISLHFKSKDNLLLAVAEELYKKYRAGWTSLALDATRTPEERLMSIIAADLSPEILNQRDIAIWFSFRAEFVSSEAYRKFIDTREREFHSTIVEICTLLKVEGNYTHTDPPMAADAIIAMLEGMWTDFHLHRSNFDRVKAMKACVYVIRNFFPKHFLADYQRLCEPETK